MTDKYKPENHNAENEHKVNQEESSTSAVVPTKFGR
jgi:hypothetical protein